MKAQTQYGVLMAVVCAVVICSNFAAVKIISLWGLPIDGGVFLFPLNFVLIDVINDKYQYKAANITTLVALIMNVGVMLYMMFIAQYPAYPGWNYDAEFNIVYGLSLRVVIASAAAFGVHFLDNYLFKKFKRGGMKFLSASLASTLIVQVIDLLIFELIAFYGILSTQDFFMQFGFALVVALIFDTLLTLICAGVRKCYARRKAQQKKLSV